jgi:FtsP/CotA-like multicopper oxidase with cupredoxin domain
VPRRTPGVQLDGHSRKPFVDEPYFRDTVLVHARETVDVGLVPLDEGRWMLHCHILEHAEAGMMSLLDVKSM